MRIIGGKYRSRPLRSLRGVDIRPTSDRLRETLFNVLTAGNPQALAGSVWLDLFAGTGAVGIEALSRGATQIYFVEASSAAAGIIRENLQSLGISCGYKLVREKMPHAFRGIERENVTADIVFLDPPYRMQESYRDTLRMISESTVIGSGSIVVAEHERKFDPGAEYGDMRRYRTLAQGSAALSFYRRGNISGISGD